MDPLLLVWLPLGRPSRESVELLWAQVDTQIADTAEPATLGSFTGNTEKRFPLGNTASLTEIDGK